MPSWSVVCTMLISSTAYADHSGLFRRNASGATISTSTGIETNHGGGCAPPSSKTPPTKKSRSIRPRITASSVSPAIGWARIHRLSLRTLQP
jgi:hypothetical protein